METLQFTPQSLQFSRTQLMNSLLFSRFKPKFFLTPYNSISNLKPFCTTTTTNSPVPFLDLKTRNCSSSSTSSTTSRNSTRVKVNGAEAARQLKEKWLHSLSCPFNQTESSTGSGVDSTATSNVGANWVIGIDPDLSGALALLKIDDSGCSTQVFDSPHLKVLVGNKIRKRLDAKSIVQLLHSFDAPIGTIAYIEQSQPFPKDGKQGWWSGGFGYGLWIGILVASGFSVVPVPSLAWKNEFELSGSKVSKDDSRRVASTLFPSLNSLLKRKKDHGRAEALLIAAYGKGLKLKSDLPSNVEEELP